MMNIAEVLGLDNGTAVDEIEVTVKKAWPRKSKENRNGDPFYMQSGTFSDGSGDIAFFMFSGEKANIDLKGGESIKISGDMERDTDNRDNSQIKIGFGAIFHDGGSNVQSKQHKESPRDDRRTTASDPPLDQRDKFAKWCDHHIGLRLFFREIERLEGKALEASEKATYIISAKESGIIAPGDPVFPSQEEPPFDSEGV